MAYKGNVVGYGSGGTYFVEMEVWDWGVGTGSAVTVFYTYRLVVSGTMSDSSNTVSWSDPWGGGTLSYPVSAGSGGGVFHPVGGDANSAVANVSYGAETRLHFRFSVGGLASGTGPSVVEFDYVLGARVPQAPDAPAVGVTNVSATQAGLFIAAFGASNGSALDLANYRVHRNSDGAHIGDLAGSGSGVNFTGLTRATAYTASAQTRNGVGWSGWSAGVVFTTLPVAPTMASSYSAGSLTRNSALISGFSVSDTGGATPSNIEVHYSLTGAETGGALTTAGGWANVTLTGLAASTTYHYRARAANSAGWGAWAGWKSFTTLSDAPNDMAAPTFSAVTDTAMRASWVAPDMNGATFTSYRYEVSLTDTFVSLITSGSTAALFVDLTGLTPGTPVFVRVRAIATPNNGGYGVASKSTTGVAPNSGLRAYICLDGDITPVTIYTFVGGVRKQVRPMWQHGPTLETE